MFSEIDKNVVSLRAIKVCFLQKHRYLFDFAKNVTKFVSWKQKKGKETKIFSIIYNKQLLKQFCYDKCKESLFLR